MALPSGKSNAGQPFGGLRSIVQSCRVAASVESLTLEAVRLPQDHAGLPRGRVRIYQRYGKYSVLTSVT